MPPFLTGDIPASDQVKLLRVQQEKVYEPLGSNEPVKADVHIITATNKDLQGLVGDGLFREDLFYRFNVEKIQLQPLRARKEGICVAFFVAFPVFPVAHA